MDMDPAQFLNSLSTGSLAFTRLTETASFAGTDFSGTDCNNMALYRCDLTGCRFDGVDLTNAKLTGCIFRTASFRGAKLNGADLRNADLTGCDIRGADLTCAWLEGAKLDGILHDDTTIHFKMRCPESGAFIAYKKCYEDRVVMMLIPKEAKRVSGTSDACRCDMAKVLTITSFDFSESFDWANSLVDENFIYHKGEWVYPDRFTEDRWCESTYGIHFWMSREEAIAY